MILYDNIGKTYNITRNADPYISSRLFELLQPGKGEQFLDIGCGTGNYLKALTTMGLKFCGIDPSATMLEKARLKNPDILFMQATAENIPLADNAIDGCIATFTMHHWSDIKAGLTELHRVLKHGTRFVTLSFTHQQMRGYWLCHYFPKMIERSMQTIPDESAMKQLFYNAGFRSVTTEKYFIREDLEDHFLYSNKFRPEQYLIPEVRDNISSFKVFSEKEEVKQGLLKLETDIKSGKINEIIKDYENDDGDYLFFVVTK